MYLSLCSLMDRVAVFGTAGRGSIPLRGTRVTSSTGRATGS